MRITEILWRNWLFSANKIKISESFSNNSTHGRTQLIIAAHNWQTQLVMKNMWTSTWIRKMEINQEALIKYFFFLLVICYITWPVKQLGGQADSFFSAWHALLSRQLPVWYHWNQRGWTLGAAQYVLRWLGPLQNCLTEFQQTCNCTGISCVHPSMFFCCKILHLVRA